jgi:hypothetical protein
MFIGLTVKATPNKDTNHERRRKFRTASHIFFEIVDRFTPVHERHDGNPERDALKKHVTHAVV